MDVKLSLTNRRSTLEVYLDVLEEIKKGSEKPTRIMYGANLSWIPLQKVLSFLIYEGLVMEIDSRKRKDRRTSKTYRLTQKGENVIQYFRKAKTLLPIKEITERAYFNLRT